MNSTITDLTSQLRSRMNSFCNSNNHTKKKGPCQGILFLIFQFLAFWRGFWWN
jgi:hypothetical protein